MGKKETNIKTPVQTLKDLKKQTKLPFITSIFLSTLILLVFFGLVILRKPRVERVPEVFVGEEVICSWGGPLPLSNLPGTGDMQSQAGYIMPNGELQQGFWRGGQGWVRTVPMRADNTPDWGNASSWGGPLPLSNLPGTGDMQSQAGYIMPNGELQQGFWRGGQGWVRTVPMRADNTPDWGNASSWGGPLPLSNLPGTGDMQSQAGYIMPNGELQQGFWRGGQGWVRTVPKGEFRP
ncbi:unnamed protein product, partial [marine sediment metagenome]